MHTNSAHIAVLGGGAWGLALARLLSENGHQVAIWEYNPQYVELIKTTRTNPVLLPGIEIPENVIVSHVLTEVLHEKIQYIVCAIPSQFLRATAKQAAPIIEKLPAVRGIINVAKGVEEHSLKRMSEVLTDELSPSAKEWLITLSGPSHAEEVARHIPTAVVIAGENDSLLQEVQALFSNTYFRVYRSSDQIGVEIGGAVKNIISIAAGIVDGLGYGDNTKGALLTRGIVEIQRLGVALGAQNETFLGLSGIGDLITTAISPHSRNRHVGYEIGLGKTLAEVLNSMSAVAEGVATTRSVYELAAKLDVDMPITQQIYEVLFLEKSPHDAICQLMTRTLKQE